MWKFYRQQNLRRYASARDVTANAELSRAKLTTALRDAPTKSVDKHTR